MDAISEKKVIALVGGGRTNDVSEEELRRAWVDGLSSIPNVKPVLKHPGHYPTEDELIELIDADAAAVLGGWVTSDLLTERFFSTHPQLRYYAGMAHGYEAMDWSISHKYNVTITNTPYGANTVAEYAFALLLEVYHHVAQRDEYVRSTDWSAPDAPSYMVAVPPQSELYGKTMGIFGLGKIGRAVARIARGFGMDVIACSRHAREGDDIENVSFEELLRRSDVVSLNASLNPSTRGIMDEKAFSLMKDGAVLINTSRGALVDEEALARALASGRLLGAGLDVLCDEPPEPNNPLLKCDNLVVTNHVAWLTRSCRLRQVEVAVDSYRAFLEGHPVNVVNVG